MRERLPLLRHLARLIVIDQLPMLGEVAEEIEGELDRQDEYDCDRGGVQEPTDNAAYQCSRRLALESTCGGRR